MGKKKKEVLINVSTEFINFNNRKMKLINSNPESLRHKIEYIN